MKGMHEQLLSFGGRHVEALVAHPQQQQLFVHPPHPN
jgi:hypothetical protein